MNDLEKEIKEHLVKTTNEIGNKVSFFGSSLYVVFAVIQYIYFLDFFNKRNTISNVIDFSVLLFVLFVMGIYNFISKFNSKNLKYFHILVLIASIVQYAVSKTNSSDMIVPIYTMIMCIGYFDWKFSLLITILANICVYKIMSYLTISTPIKEILWQNYNLLPFIHAISLCVVIISKKARDYLFDRIKAHILEDKEQKEFLLASKIQSGFLNHDYIENDNFDVAAGMYPSKEVGGDFYDFFINDHNKLLLVIADVSGKGVPASLFMATAKTLLYVNMSHGVSFEKALEKTNRMLVENNPEMQFVTMFVAEVNLSSGIMHYINAGHNKPCIIHKNGSVEFITSKPDLFMGARKVVRYHSQEYNLEVGDKLFLYTDGVTERFNTEKQLYGKERLVEALKEIHNKSVKEFITLIKEKLDEYGGEEPQNDDITCLAFEYKKPKKLENRIVKEIKGDNFNYKELMDFVRGTLENKKVPVSIINIMAVATDEIISNILKYAYEDESIIKDIRVSIQVEDNIVSISYIDNGRYYNPLMRVDGSKTTKVTEKSKIGGLGIITVWNIVDDMKYERFEKYNMLTVVKEY